MADTKYKMVPTRDGFGEGVVELGRKNKELKLLAPRSFKISLEAYCSHQFTDPFVCQDGTSIAKGSGKGKTWTSTPRDTQRNTGTWTTTEEPWTATDWKKGQWHTSTIENPEGQGGEWKDFTQSKSRNWSHMSEEEDQGF